MARWEVDFGTSVVSEDKARRYRGMNPAMVERVWAERRRQKEKERREKVRKLSNGSVIVDKVEPKTELINPFEAAKEMVKIDFSTVKEAKEIAIRLYDITLDQMINKSKKHRCFYARHALICAIKLKWPEASLPFIGKYLDMDHTSVRYALMKYGIDTSGATNDSAISADNT